MTPIFNIVVSGKILKKALNQEEKEYLFSLFLFYIVLLVLSKANNRWKQTGKEEVKVPLFAQYNFICQRL